MSEKETKEKKIISEDRVPFAIRRKIQQKIDRLQDEYKSAKASGNIDRAIELLSELIFSDKNTLDRRKDLRELYSRKCTGGNPVEYGYLKVMETGIEDGEEDYIRYLKEQCQPYRNAVGLDDNAINLIKRLGDILFKVGRENEAFQLYEESRLQSRL